MDAQAGLYPCCFNVTKSLLSRLYHFYFIFSLVCVFIIGVAHIMQVTHMGNKNSNIQGRSLNVIKETYHTIRNCSQRKELAPSGSKFFPLREVPILKRDAVEENHCLIQ